MDELWVKALTLFLGIGILIIGFLKPKEKHFEEEKVAEIIEEFTLQLTLENDEFIHKIKESQNQLSMGVNKKISHIERKLEQMENTRISPNPIQSMNPKYQEVLRLYKNGESTHQIAQKTNMGQGEVELVVDLMKKGFANV